MTDLQRFDAPGPPRLPKGFDVPFAEAISWAVQRGVKLAPAFYATRLQAVRARSFTVTGLATLDQVQQVADAATVATAGGQTFRDWQRAVLTSDKAGELFSLGRARRELIFRNAVQTNYGIGRTIQQRENATARPYLMWDAINDSRTRDSHRVMDGHIAPIGAPVWRAWNAPAGHNCRCTRIALTEAQARARGYPKLAPIAEPDKGWEGDPTEGNDDLVRVVQARRDACGTTFAPNFKGRGLWCDDGAAMDRMLQAAAALARNSDFPSLKLPGAMLRIPAQQFSQPELFRHFVDAVGQRLEEAPWMRDLGITVGPDKSLFTRQDGAWKIGKNGRSEWLEFLADSLIDPAEVRLVDAAPNAARQLLILGGHNYGGRPLHTMLVYLRVDSQWLGQSAYQIDSTGDLFRYRSKSMLVWTRK